MFQTINCVQTLQPGLPTMQTFSQWIQIIKQISGELHYTKPRNSIMFHFMQVNIAFQRRMFPCLLYIVIRKEHVKTSCTTELHALPPFAAISHATLLLPEKFPPAIGDYMIGNTQKCTCQIIHELHHLLVRYTQQSL